MKVVVGSGGKESLKSGSYREESAGEQNWWLNVRCTGAGRSRPSSIVGPAGRRWDNEAEFGPFPDSIRRRYDGGVSILGVLPVRSRIELQDVNGAVESHLLDMRVDCEDPLQRPGRSGS